jgi:hypothetical protein
MRGNIMMMMMAVEVVMMMKIMITIARAIIGET